MPRRMRRKEAPPMIIDLTHTITPDMPMYPTLR